MIETFYGLDTLGTPAALLVSFVIGLAFGTSLEQAGFGSSRRLSGIFYFRDMTVLKVMFTAVLTAMLGLSWLLAAGVVKLDSINLLETIYGAQILGGLLLGIGFVMGGWCPGTAAVGLAGGSLDALLFLFGAMGGSIIFNEWYPKLAGLTDWGNRGVVFIYDTLGVSRPGFALAFTIMGVIAFWASELLEEKMVPAAQRLPGDGGLRKRAPLLTIVSLGLLLLAVGLYATRPTATAAKPAAKPTTTATAPATPVALPQPVASPGGSANQTLEAALLATIEAGDDHIDPEDLADRMMNREPGLLVVDLRPADEFEGFHLPGAVNIPLPQLAIQLAPYKNRGKIVLCSNGMTHPAQARDALSRLGYTNVFLLTDGLEGFRNRCLKPASIRSEPLSADQVARINAWRRFFQASEAPAPTSPPAGNLETGNAWPAGLSPKIEVPGLIEPDWLAANLERAGLKLLDLRPQPEYNSGHIPGALSLQVESLRGMVDGVPSMLLPSDMLARQFSLLGLLPSDLVVCIHGDKVHDATLAGLALERLGHRFWGVLHGGFPRWSAEKRAVSKDLPRVTPFTYPVPSGPDTFTVGIDRVVQAMKAKTPPIIDVRPADFFTGKKSDEARAGHIPGARNRPYLEDLTKDGEIFRFKAKADLEQAWKALGAAPDQPVILHCRTGHQASQAYFILRHLLGYRQVLWYDGGWTEWSTRSDLPVATAP